MNKNIATLIIIIIALAFIGGIYWFVSTRESDTASTYLETNQNPITSDENLQPGTTGQDVSGESAAAMARKDLASKLSIDEKNIVILKITEATWSDGCLGLGKANESCLQALVPGFKIEMLANGKTYIYRTDKTGAIVRAEVGSTDYFTGSDK